MRYRRAGMTVEVPVPANAVGAAMLDMRRWLDDMRFNPSSFNWREIDGRFVVRASRPIQSDCRV
jgi:hypothetical protein